MNSAGAYSILVPLEEVDLENRDFFGPQWHSLLLVAIFFRAQKSLYIFRAHPFQWPSKWICLYQNHYVPALNNRYINRCSYNVPDKIQMNNLKLEPTSFFNLPPSKVSFKKTMLNACSFLEPIYPWVNGKIHTELCVPIKSTKPNKYHWTLVLFSGYPHLTRETLWSSHRWGG